MTRELHGLSRTTSYPVWCGIKTRCYNKNSAFYAEYGGRGISMCQRWLDSFQAFHDDMGERPAGMTIERLNNDLGYEPGNCVWADRKTQSRNRRGRHLLTIAGETRSMSEWAESSGISVSTIWARIKYGWSDEAAVRTPIGGAGFGPKKKHATAAARDVDMRYREYA